jgi:hypothetical protein
VKVGDKRRLTRDLQQSTVCAVWTVPAGTVIEIEQVDKEYNKVIVNNVWEYAPHIERISEEVN